VKRLAGLLPILLVGCTFTVSTPEKHKPAIHGYVHHRTHRTASKTTVVDAAWMLEYHRLQATHGDYTVPDDMKIEPLEDGKFRIPKSVLKHFKDLSRTPAATPTP